MAKFRYADFINQLRPLLAQIDALQGEREGHQAHAFRQWRHALNDLLLRVGEQGYRPHCHVGGRRFGAGRWMDRQAPLRNYVSDLRETQIELSTIIANFDRDGTPPTPPRSADSLAVPDTITPAWLWRHLSVTAIAALLSGAVGIFMAGVYVGQSKLYADLMHTSSPVDSTQPAAKTPRP
ncbi:hypothetical protein ACFFU8_09490 [Chromobacterium piscinae]|uniref:hypothetical protein n=1 Tax=Chromobacterium piscinae TaxID=686831 RepID=UPI001E3AE0ED|nr:hypothetical protein [Chromobacterium piscinae]MCD5327863.1 hypothetical protein [Chromobacterium piscinae]